jgi:hypothetical protein
MLMRGKLARFITNVRYLGDVGKAAKKARVSRDQLDRWMSDPEISAQIDETRRDALTMSYKGETAEDILFRAKIVPELEKDGEIFRETGQRHRESKIIAKLAAKDLKAHRWDIVQAANNNDRGFFIDLGRILSGEISRDFNYDKIDHCIAEICTASPGISTRSIQVELKKRGYSVEEQTIRTRKMRLGLTKRQVANRDKT